MAATRWVLLSSRLPRDPSRLRLGVWRRLRRLGAVLLHDAVWALPADAKTREAFEWLAEEIVEHGGSAFVWEADSMEPAQDRELIRRFRAEADARYAAIARSARDILRTITRPRARAGLMNSRTAPRQLTGLERALRLERRRDYFRAAGRQHAQAVIEAAIAALEASPRKASAAPPSTCAGSSSVTMKADARSRPSLPDTSSPIPRFTRSRQWSTMPISTMTGSAPRRLPGSMPSSVASAS